MKEANIEQKLRELVEQFGSAPNSKYQKLAAIAKEAQETQKKLEKSVDSLQEAMDYLRVCIKYQLFDLEATRRENKYLRQLLEERES
ncbi:MAG: hypothetical protein WDA68_02975 [Phycisphaerae bacterium]